MSQERIDFNGFHWLDIGNPNPDTLQQLAEEYDLHATSVQDCLQPEHLPKFETVNEVNFCVLRAFDGDCSAEADTVQELTRKLAIFYADRFIITIHRRDQSFLSQLMAKWRKIAEVSNIPVTPEHILVDLLNESVKTYEPAIRACVKELDVFEMEIFGTAKKGHFRLKNGYYLKRKVSVFRRMLRTTQDPMHRVAANAPGILKPDFQNVKEMADNLNFYCDEVTESMTSLLNLYVSLASQKTNEASHRTNEVMRVLTIFSCFFLPVNFLASIYGMNFRFMPETQWEYGYFAALTLMATIALSIFLWFKRRRWL